jgi:hypothetical protein
VLVAQKLHDASANMEKLKQVLEKNSNGWSNVALRVVQEKLQLQKWAQFDAEIQELKKMKASGTAPSAKNLVVD